MKLVHSHGYSVMAVSLRCHGDSTGQVNDLGWSARQDVIAAVAFLERECPGLPIYVVAQSLGSAAAIYAGQSLYKYDPELYWEALLDCLGGPG